MTGTKHNNKHCVVSFYGKSLYLLRGKALLYQSNILNILNLPKYTYRYVS
jgi:hypothetical protein